MAKAAFGPQVMTPATRPAAPAKPAERVEQRQTAATHAASPAAADAPAGAPAKSEELYSPMSAIGLLAVLALLFVGVVVPALSTLLLAVYCTN